MSTFFDFPLAAGVASRLATRGITTPSPIQQEALPHALAGHDVLGRARTGTGKTLAFALPIVTRLEPSRERGRAPRAIALAPTRELAKQVAKEFALLGGLEVLELYGGTSYSPQERALSRGVDVVVGTPGRVNDHLERGNLDLTQLEVLVLDEADEMLSMGFQEQVESVLKNTPTEKQTLLFSATLPRWVMNLAKKYQNSPVVVDLVGEQTAVQNTSVEHIAIKVAASGRTKVLADLLTVIAPERAIIFTRTKRDCDELALELIHRGLEAEAIHGDLAQSQRERALESFRSGRARVLVATDVAARGLDIPDIELVVQHHFPQDVESYVHRSGRTGRAGRAGRAVVLYTPREERDLRRLEHESGAHFSRQDAPTPSQVQAAAAKNAGLDVRRIHEAVIAPFRAEAEELLQEFGPDALARALAYIAGVHQPPKPQSLITGEEGYTTVLLRDDRLSIPRTVAILARATGVNSKLLGKVRLVRGGSVADVPTELVAGLLERGVEDASIEIPNVLPEILEAPKRDFDPSRKPDGFRGGYKSANGGGGGYHKDNRGGGQREDRGNSGGRGGFERRGSGPREGRFGGRR